MDKNTLNILIVDDSLIFRHAVEEALKNEKDIKVTGSVRNGVKALEFIKQNKPDIVTLDVEMPDMNGLETLENIQNINSLSKDNKKIGVIMLSAHTQKGADVTIKALEKGAFDFIEKPAGKDEDESISLLKRSLVPKINYYRSISSLSFSKNKIEPASSNIKRNEKFIAQRHLSDIEAIFIGVSTGGPKALTQILPTISSSIQTPILIVQHMPAKFTQSLAESLDKKCKHNVKEGEHGETIKNNNIYIAPGGHHMIVRTENNTKKIYINDNPPENGCKPAVDVLFRSIPNAYKNKAIAVIMTGMGSDGAKSMRSIKRAGIYTIAQDEKSSVVWGMPGSAVNTGFIDIILPLFEIPNKIVELVKQKK